MGTRVRIDFSDGEYRLIPVGKSEKWLDEFTVPSEVWALYQDHQEQCKWWHDAIGKVDNELRRERK